MYPTCSERPPRRKRVSIGNNLTIINLSTMSTPHSTAHSGFLQTPPSLHNQFTHDHLIQRILRRQLGPHLYSDLEPTFSKLGAEAISHEKHRWTDDANRHLPEVIHWDGWGRRIDRLVTAEGWSKLKGFWAQTGMLEDIYSRRYGVHSRTVGFTKYDLGWMGLM